jgi:hypothetical protein
MRWKHMSVLKSLQGTKVPRFYGHFIAPLPSQDGRTVNVILLEQVAGTDLRTLVPDEVTEKLCLKHKDALIDAAPLWILKPVY